MTWSLDSFGQLWLTAEVNRIDSIAIAGTVKSLELHQQDVYVSTYGGAWKIKKDSIQQFSEKGISALTKSPQGTIVGYIEDKVAKKGVIYDFHTEKIIQYHTGNKLESLAFSANHVWAGSTEGLHLAEHPNLSMTSFPNNFFHDFSNVYDLATVGEFVLVGLQDGMYILDGKKKVVAKISSNLGVRTIAADNRAFWFIKDGRLHFLKKDNLTNRHPEAVSADVYVTNEVVRDLTLGTNQRLWFATDKIGCVDLRSQQIVYLEHPMLEHTLFNKVVKQPKGRLWVGTINRGLLKIDIDEQMLDSLLQIIPITALTADFDFKPSLQNYTLNNIGIPISFTGIPVKKDFTTVEYFQDSITIAIRDYKDPDGDVISLYLNDELLIENYTLLTGFKEFNLKLEEGDNFLLVKAEYEGTKPKATIGLKYDDEYTKLSSSKNECDIINFKKIKTYQNEK